METIPIGMLGLGTVGRGVLRVLSDSAEDIRGRLSAQLEVRRVAVRDVSKSRPVDLTGISLSGDPQDVLSDPEIRIVVELVGGITDAKKFVLEAIQRGKHVVTANKALLATAGDEIFGAAREKGVDVFYEAAVGGGIPIVRTLRESLASERIQSVVGILNGTTNFILSEMVKSGRSFEDVLSEAQRVGYAEADPSADVDGHDAAQKISILGSLAFSTRLNAADVSVEGIRSIEPSDLEVASERGYSIKLLAIAERKGASISARVHPCWVHLSSMFAHVDGVLNAVLVQSDALGSSMLIGQGAGELPTGSAVVADLIDLARSIRLGSTGRVPYLATHEDAMVAAKHFDPGEVEMPYCLRFSVTDQPGVLGRLAGVLGEHGISLRTVQQDSLQAETPVSVAAVTHAATERSVKKAVSTIDALPTTLRPSKMMRIFSES